jgi:hypothetical protein
MLTPAEEVGLAGHGVAARVRRAMGRLDDGELRELLQTIEAAAWARHCVYERDGHFEVVRILPTPLTVLPDQLQYLHAASLALHQATRRAVPLFLNDPAVRAVLPVPEQEAAWIRELWTPQVAETNPVFGRLDAVLDLTSAHWKQTLQFIEPNMNGVGGLHLLPAAERVVQDVVFPVLRQQDPSLAFELAADVRALLMQQLLEHLEAIGEDERTLCFLEPTRSDTGPDDQAELAAYCEAHFGVTALHADPSELELRGNEVLCQGRRVACAYRDYALADVLALEAQGVDVEPMRQLFLQNRMVSSIGGELDQKSLFELFTDETHAHHFSSDERHLFRRHVPWTRLLRERRTSLLDGTVGDLVPWVRQARESLVLKPNRAYGGTGVVVGSAVTQAGWDAALGAALEAPASMVVQRLAPLPVVDFPVVGRDEQLHVEPFFLVLGLAPTDDGVAVLGRASQKLVVNVAQRGGLVVAAVAKGPERMMR